MSELEILINIAAVILMLFVVGAQSYVFGSLLMGKLLELHDVYMIRRRVPDGLCCCGDMEENHGYSSNHSVVYAIDYGVENARKWERG